MAAEIEEAWGAYDVECAGWSWGPLTGQAEDNEAACMALTPGLGSKQELLLHCLVAPVLEVRQRSPPSQTVPGHLVRTASLRARSCFCDVVFSDMGHRLHPPGGTGVPFLCIWSEFQGVGSRWWSLSWSL